MATADNAPGAKQLTFESARVAGLLGDLVMGGLFLFAGLTKLGSPEKMAGAIARYELLPTEWVSPLGHILPWWEVAWAVLLLTRRLVQPSRWVLMGLLVVYTVAALSAWLRGLDAQCGCFGEAGGSPEYVVARNALIVLVSGGLWWLSCRRSRGEDRVSDANPIH